MQHSASLLSCAALVAAVACHRQPLAPGLLPPIEDYCWWTYQSTTVPFGAVAGHFAKGFARVGFDHVQQFNAGDTAWATAGPTPLDSPSGRPRWSARVVAYAVGDSTHFRVFVGLAPRFSRWANAADSVAAEGNRIPMCGQIFASAGVPSVRPGRDPNALDSLPVWRRGALR